MKYVNFAIQCEILTRHFKMSFSIASNRSLFSAESCSFSSLSISTLFCFWQTLQMSDWGCCCCCCRRGCGRDEWRSREEPHTDGCSLAAGGVTRAQLRNIHRRCEFTAHNTQSQQLLECCATSKHETFVYFLGPCPLPDRGKRASWLPQPRGWIEQRPERHRTSTCWLTAVERSRQRLRQAEQTKTGAFACVPSLFTVNAFFLHSIKHAFFQFFEVYPLSVIKLHECRYNYYHITLQLNLPFLKCI